MHAPPSLLLWAALVPLAIYLLGIAMLHVGRRPIAVPGGWDLMFLSAAVIGLCLGGPLALLQPADAAGAWRWAVPLVSGALLVAGGILATRPRVVVYNISMEQLRPVVAAVATDLDASARWAGETVALPERGVQVHLDARGGMRSVSLVAVGRRTSPEGWAEFSRRVRGEIKRLRVRSSPWAMVFAGLGAAVLGIATWGARAALFPVPPALPPASSSLSLPLSGVPDAGARRSFAA
jgi:hypothetical protein